MRRWKQPLTWLHLSSHGLVCSSLQEALTWHWHVILRTSADILSQHWFSPEETHETVKSIRGALKSCTFTSCTFFFLCAAQVRMTSDGTLHVTQHHCIFHPILWRAENTLHYSPSLTGLFFPHLCSFFPSAPPPPLQPHPRFSKALNQLIFFFPSLFSSLIFFLPLCPWF